MGNKLVRGSLIIFIGNIIFRIGGYLYRFLMATLLGPVNNGILGTTLSFQGIFQTLSAGGLPPAISKYIAEYNAVEDYNMARQTIYTALKIMVFLGISLGFLMIFVIAPFIAYNFMGKPEVMVPLQIIGLITPFSVIMGAFRGAFQGVYKMEYIVYNMPKYIPQPTDDFEFSFRDELKLGGMLVKFSIPVIITAIAEMLIYNICTIIMGKFLTLADIGFFTAADPIARLPLMISISVATTILPASSEAFKIKDIPTLQKYVSEAYKISLLFVVPMCIGLALFAAPTLKLLYFKTPAYVAGASALAILSIGMTFYSIFAISTSIVQGIGNPRIPMYILIFGSLTTAGLCWYLVPFLGIAGGATATTISCFLMMVPCIHFVFKLTETKAPKKAVVKIVGAALIMGVAGLFIPKTTLWLFPGIIICMIVYFFALILVRFFTEEDIATLREYSLKLGPLSKFVNKVLNFVERIEFKK